MRAAFHAHALCVIGSMWASTAGRISMSGWVHMFDMVSYVCVCFAYTQVDLGRLRRCLDHIVWAPMTTTQAGSTKDKSKRMEVRGDHARCALFADFKRACMHGCEVSSCGEFMV